MNRIKLLITLFCFFNLFQNSLPAQNIGDLKAKLKAAKHDSDRCNLLSEMIDAEPDETVWPAYNAQLLEISEKNIKQLKSTDKSLKKFKMHYANALNNIAYIALVQAKNEKALSTLEKCVEIQKEINDEEGLSNSYNSMAGLYINIGNIAKALQYFDACIKIQMRIKDMPGLAASYFNAATVYEEQGAIAKALLYYNKSRAIYEDLKDNNGLGSVLDNIGKLYNKTGDKKLSLEYSLKAFNCRKTGGNKGGIANSLHNLGSLYVSMGDTAKAIDYFTQCIALRKEIGDDRGKAYSLVELAGIYKNRGDLKKASTNFNESIEILEKVNDKKGLCLALNNSMTIYLLQKDYKKAEENLKRGLSLAKELGYADLIRSSAEGLAIVYKEQGNYKAALENYVTFITMRDSITNIAAQKSIIQQQTDYDYQKRKAIADKENELKIKQQEEKAQAEKAKQNIIIGAVSLVLLIVAVFSVFLYNRFKVTQRQKAIIELKEKETQQQKHIIEEKHKEITDSINYAERIQRSFLATKEVLSENLPTSTTGESYFILFKPKDVVSGDFYWASLLNNGNFAFATADSTGHGVPGAIMSLLNITSLEKAIEHTSDPAEILNLTRKTIIERLKKDGSKEGGKDGMDCSLISLNKHNMTMEVAVANNPVWVVRNSEMIEIKPDKMPVGKHDKDNESFTLHTIQLQKGDTIYTLTDGYPDQFGGEKGKKFMVKKLKELILVNQHLNLTEQKGAFENTFQEWVGDLEQIDDVTLVGIRV